MTRDDLIAFEDALADDFNRGLIKAPLHLAGGNESALIEIFKGIRPRDYILSQWRSHYHCLLAGVPPDELRAAINDKLDEVAAELDKLSQGTYTTAQTPAGLVRAMKVTSSPARASLAPR